VNPSPRDQIAFRLARQRVACLLIAFGMLAAVPLHAASCNLSVQPVAFGNYDFQSSEDLESVGHVIVRCDTSTGFTIALSPGSGTFAARSMQSGTHRLFYNLYTDATRTLVWGDGSAGSGVVGDSGTEVDRTVYGNVPAGQNPYAGMYGDAVTVTLSF